ncbi:chemotaxis protein CheW [Oxalobacteraceae bacterium A2-2]
MMTPAQADQFLPYLPEVARCEQSLHELNQMWQLIEASARMNCPNEARLLLPAMAATRTAFGQLEKDLVANLVQEKVRHVLDDLGTQARYAIDILVRNLFERTADVGFLATDTELCRYAAGLDDDAGAARARLAAYRAKYTVYDEILVLAPDGAVLLQADGAAPVTRSADPLLAETLSTSAYVETFRASDLRPGQARALIYSQRMLHPDTGAPAGVLCLCFNFEQEMAAIFEAYRDPSQRANMLLLDGQDRIISSADPLWMAPGAAVPARTGGADTAMFAGREYLVRTAGSNGYQGYPGPPGWQGQLMQPLELAFRGARADALAGCDPALLQELLSHAHRFSPTLAELMATVGNTTHTIGRIVWNGKVTSAAGGGDGASKLGIVLDQIADTGQRSDALFSQSIQDLYQTVLGAGLRAARGTTRLLADLLDRNLYERANDCRWWALSSTLRRGLAHPEQTGAMRAVLDYINGLYTVYTRLFVYDRAGRIVASTGSQDVLGSHIDSAVLGRVCALRSEQDHYPEPFGPSALYGGQPTFIYHAAIRHPEQDSQVVGGIGIVFDAAPELHNMLQAGVAGRPRMQAYFVAPDGTVLASTDEQRPIGARLELAGGWGLGQDGGGARIAIQDGQYVIAACSRAGGYREFRQGEAAEQPVLAVLLESFGPVQARGAAVREAIERRSDAGPDFALFYVNGALMGLDARRIQEAVPYSKIQKTAGGGGARLGMLDVPANNGTRRQVVWVYDLALLLGGPRSAPGEYSQVILVRDGEATVGLLVDELHSVQRFDLADIIDNPMGSGARELAPRLIQANQGRVLIQELCAERLFARLRA